MRYLFFFLLFSSFYSCSSFFNAGAEAIDNPASFRRAKKKQSLITHSFSATLETPAVQCDIKADDAADDPALWYNYNDPTKSIIFGSNKRAGIHAYTLNGQEQQFVSCGFVNNIDVRQNVLFGDKTVDVLAGSNRSYYGIDLFIINEEGRINTEADYKIELGSSEPYGFCLYKTQTGHLHAFVNNKEGDVFQIAIDLDENGQLNSQIVRQLKLPNQVEGMVVNDDTHQLYIGEEEAAIHIFSAKADGLTRGRILKGSTKQNPNIRYDIEGLALIPPKYLVASSQGNFSYAVFDLEKENYLSSFSILDGQVDGVEETDGLEVCALPLGKQYPNGILMLQDGFNFDDNHIQNQNYKIVNLKEIIDQLKLK